MADDPAPDHDDAGGDLDDQGPDDLGTGLAETDDAGSGRTRRVVLADDHGGDRIILASWIGTGAYAASAVLAVIALDTFQLLLMIVTVTLFVIGLIAFVVAYLLAVVRSREDLIGMGGLFFLAGTAPKRVQRHLMASFGAEIVIASVTSSIGLASLSSDATNPLAFGFLTPIFGLGLAGVWGARFGVFAPRALGPSERDSRTG